MSKKIKKIKIEDEVEVNPFEAVLDEITKLKEALPYADSEANTVIDGYLRGVKEGIGLAFGVVIEAYDKWDYGTWDKEDD